MGRYAREEIEQAFERYKWARDEASRTGDWSIWANCFTPDAHYIEHAYGEIDGREAIDKWITEVMAPFPTMTFPYTWEVFDEKTDAYVFEALNADRKSTRLNSSHLGISYAVFCLKKKK